MWRHDAGRTGATADVLPENLALKWVRHLPKTTPAYQSPRLQFDAGYEPIVADGRVLIASSRNDSVTAYDASTGRELWVYRTNGPVRFAPAVWKHAVCFGSDDGHFYCVEISTGKLRWKHRTVPSDRRLLGNRRLISVWPVRGGPVVADGQVYFASGVWPFEGVFVMAMDIATGDVVWRNERLGSLFGQQPHETKAIGGLAPQGYLIVNGEELIIPCSTAYPARLNRKTGKLIEFKLPAPGRLPGGWFAALDPATARDIRRGKVKFDDVINQQRHEDTIRKGHGETGISRKIRVGERWLKFNEKIEGVTGTIHSMLAADRRLFVSTREGTIYCFGEADESQAGTPKVWKDPVIELSVPPQSIKQAETLIRQASSTRGIALVIGLEDGNLVKSLLLKSNYHIVSFDDDADRVTRLRRELQLAGLYGMRVAVIQCDPQRVSLPPYLVSLMTTESPNRMANSWSPLLQTLRPFGGVAALGIKPGTAMATTQKLKSLGSGTFELTELNGQAIIRRVGSLPGAAQYKGNYALSEDTLVRFPLGVLWFDDTLAHFKRSPQPQFIDGVMVSRPKNWHRIRVRGDYSVDYPLHGPVLSDIYTGRVFDDSEHAALRKTLPDFGRTTPQPSYYHAPHQKTALNPKPPVVGERTNPITGMKEPRAFPKTYGCDGGVDYGLLYTLRSGTAAFYDKKLESGTVFLSGPRSGCTNSIIPSGGLLNVPYFYEGCTCSYPLPTALSLVAMPESHEQWSSWGDDPIKPGTIQRIGLNFGAPGDRKTREGTLWLDYPSIGGPSPKIRVETKPETPIFHYRHSLWMKGGTAWPWVAASSMEGANEIRLNDLKPGRYTVRLYFAEPFNMKVGERIQNISLQGRTVLSDFDILAESKHSMTGIVRQLDDILIDETLTLDLNAKVGKSLISGIEVIRVQ